MTTAEKKFLKTHRWNSFCFFSSVLYKYCTVQMAVMPPPTSLRCEHSPDSPVIIYKPKEGFETGTFPTIFQDDDVFKHPIMSSTTNTTSSLHEDEVSEI